MPEASDKGNMLLVGEDGTVRDVVSQAVHPWPGSELVSALVKQRQG